MSAIVRCLSPVDGRVVAERKCASPDQVQAVFARAREAQQDWRRLAVGERAAYCLAAVDAMGAMSDDIVPELAWQMGRPVRFGAGELGGLDERARHMVAIAETALANLETDPKPGFSRWIAREPVGVVFTVAPWNYPYLTSVNSVIPALMAGNAVVLKSARQTLLAGERFEAAFKSAGLPEGLFQTVVLDHQQTGEAAADLADMTCFTGSVRAGAALEQAVAGRFRRLGLELGGKDPAYVRADADLDFAIENLVDGAFFNSGQSCCAVERIYVHRDLFENFVEGFVATTRAYRLGDPLDPETTLGPLVSTTAADTVRDQIRDAVAHGARAHIEDGAFAQAREGSPYLGPQVLTGVDHTMAVMTEESFGPVIGIMPVDGDEDAVALMNDSRFGLTASLWTADPEAAAAIGDRVQTGTVFMNRCDYLDPALAWTGVGESGRGSTLSPVGYEQLTRAKSFHLRLETGT